MGSVEPTPDQIQAFLKSEDDGSPVVMVNLLRYRDRAAYPPDFDAEPCSGREAYQRYSAVALQRIASVGGQVLWLGDVRATVIAPAEEQWHDAVLVQYPTRQAFFDMIAQPEYNAAVPHRSAALEDSRLIATRTQASFPPG
jgi:uncharacterized protein (DUF1330 family)